MVGKFPKEEEVNALRELFRPHIESFDYFIDQGLETALSAIRPIEIRHPETSRKLRIWFGKPELSAPIAEGRFTSRTPIYPQQCRESNSTYKGRFAADVYFQYDGGVAIRENIKFGHIPIMLMSKLCHLRGADPRKLVAHREEATEMGGYFVCNGMERLVRLLILQKSNYPMAMVRKSFVSRGDGYTDTAVSIRCCREDQTSASLRVYYIQNGSARVGFWVGLREILLPVGILLKALVDVSDREIYADLTSIYDEENRKESGAVGTQLAGERAKIILDELRDMSLLTHVQCLQHIGQMLQPVIRRVFDENSVVAGKAVLQEFILVHLGNDHDKYNLLIFMLQKLFAVVDHTATPDNADALQNQEVLTAGLLFTTFLKAKMEGWLNKAKQTIEDELKKPKPDCDFDKPQDIKKLMDKSSSAIGKSVDSMMRTGKLGSINTADLPQREGMTIPAEKLNYLRFLSHFRSVHRGAAFAKMRTTTVRKLLPESWGFLCPVHTPDGTPCGLLNHMTYTCRISSHYDSQGGTKDFLKIRMSILNTLVRMGMVPLLPKLERAAPPEFLSVLLDGCVVGSMASSKIEQAVAHFRKLKLSSPPVIPSDLEVGYVPLSFGGAFPGLYLFTGPSRFLRPVRNISVTDTDGNIELIGPFEQAFMEIRCADGGDGGRNDLFPATHEEIHPTRMLSVVANLTPWSDHNQSPRNMYQCQMAKQTMGTYSQAVRFRLDNKAYQLQTPQSPIVRTRAYKEYCLDEFPSGTNAIVAVLAYTGYDMEDAMILNKSSVERGLCRGHIYQTECVDLEQNRRTKSDISEVFTKSTAIGKTATTDSDGLPLVGQALNPKETLYTTYNRNTGQTRNTDLKGSEPAFIDHVAIDGTGSNINIEEVQKVNIRLRRPRNPVIGDKFSSRHGQKGVCSQLWPDIDMPFSAVTGMRPDLIINPHAFPSRMTIAMLLESIAAKGGSLKGEFVDATPFAASTRESPESDSESDSPVDKLGPLLASYGFNYHGLEVMYSGVFGTELAFEIFIGPVYYQRLRHMVSDKFQVRSTGPIDQITRQPVGGRKRGGGIRFGEMERDAVIAHGAAYLLHDRLHTCSDYHVADVCSLCGSVLTSTTIQKQKRFVIDVPGLPPLVKPPKLTTCLTCKTSKGMETVAMPYVFKYLASELAAMNIKLILNLSKETEN